MKIKYEDATFYSKALKLIEQANVIIEEYAKQGYSLTLRQLYYQFVSRMYIPNNDKEYKRLGETISNARRAGLIDWDAIVDRTRYLRKEPSWSDPAAIVASCAEQFRLNPWLVQQNYVELWFEKDALLGVFERAAERYRLPYFSCRGYSSDSECWGAAQRLRVKHNDGKNCVVLHFGDHDPSGIDMTRDITDRLELFGAHVDVRRMALNMDQVKRYNPPPNPAKESDSRFADYVNKFGDESWELDALEPDVLVTLVNNAVRTLVNKKKWDATLALEETHRAQLSRCSERWSDVCGMLEQI